MHTPYKTTKQSYCMKKSSESLKLEQLPVAAAAMSSASATTMINQMNNEMETLLVSDGVIKFHNNSNNNHACKNTENTNLNINTNMNINMNNISHNYSDDGDDNNELQHNEQEFVIGVVDGEGEGEEEHSMLLRNHKDEENIACKIKHDTDSEPKLCTNIEPISTTALTGHDGSSDSGIGGTGYENFGTHHFSNNKNNIAKLRWWNSPIEPLQLSIAFDADTTTVNQNEDFTNNKTVESPIKPNKINKHPHAHSHGHHFVNEPAGIGISTISTHLNPNTNVHHYRRHYVHQHSTGSVGTPSHHRHSHRTRTVSRDTLTTSQTSMAPGIGGCGGGGVAMMDPITNEDDQDISQHSHLLANQEPDACVGLLNPNDEDEMKITGYRRNILRTLMCWLCICLTGGLLRLVLHWWRHWYLKATHVICALNKAERVLIEEEYQGKHKTYYIKKVQTIDFVYLKEILEQGSGASKRKLSISPKRKSSTGESKIDDAYSEKKLYLPVHFESTHFKHCKSVSTFLCKQLRYAWDADTHSFRKLKGLDVNVPSTYFHQQKGLTDLEQTARRVVYGPNEITVPYKNIKTLLFLEVLNPFYVFQLFSVVLWFAYDYYYYACVILLMSIFGIAMSIIQTKKNQDALRKTAQNTGTALVLSNRNEVSEVPTQLLVPGDIIEIPTSGCTMQCDAILLSGNCILDESMLTGESVPITKTPLPIKYDIFDKKEHSRHILFCGTKVIQTRYIGSEKVLAIVINTGNITAKGGLIRSILYPPPVDYKFEQDSYKFIECLAVIALIGFTYTLVTKIIRQIDPIKIAVESLDLITIVVPPALPAAMTVGRLYAQERLKRSNIYCISPRSINVAGSIDCCCFDKTGTLTEDGLDMWGVVPKTATNQFQIPIQQVSRLPCDDFLFGMVTCHSITVMNGKMMGDPLDLKMFESTGWILDDPKGVPDSQKYGLMYPTIVRSPPSKVELNATITENRRQNSLDDLLADVGLLNGEANNDHGIVREFPFTSNLQRMSVITRRLSEKHFKVYCKGSPEMLQQLCLPQSIPDNYSQQLAVFAKQGYRVIALGCKSLSPKMNYTKIFRLARETVESDLEFLGFIVLENRLKPDTTNVIRTIRAANIRTIMITGDNILTALSVARDCGIVSAEQAVITVNVRQLDNNDNQNQTQTSHNYELYYNLELASKEYLSFGMSNGNTAENRTPRIKDNIPKDKDKDADGAGDGADADADADASAGAGVGGYKTLGDIISMNSSQYSLPNSSSLTSVQTAETWTHNQDAELGMKTKKILNEDGKDEAIGWQKNYRFAMVGKTWQVVREYFPEEMYKFITRGAIFARMSPEQKQSLIMELQSLDYCVAMCGDGANDCGALKVAHTGISLSETESSIASPFTSLSSTIACVPNVIKEGRAALVTSFGIFKYMAAYSMVQFISVMILYSIDSNLTDMQYLYIDLGIIAVLAFFFGKTEAYPGPLSKQVPLSSLISLAPLSSIMLHLLVVIFFQVAAWLQLHAQPWFVPFQLADADHLGCYENYTMFTISGFQYIILAFVFSKGAPYRKAIYTNWPFCLTLIVNTLIVSYLVLYPHPWLADLMQLIMPMMDFRIMIMIYGVLNFLMHAIVEIFLVEYLIFKKFQAKREQNLQTSKRKYMRIEYELRNLKEWPKISDVYETHEGPALEDTSPSYVEIKAEHQYEVPTPKNNALNNFFDIDSHHNTPTKSFNQPVIPDTIMELTTVNEKGLTVNDAELDS